MSRPVEYGPGCWRFAEPVVREHLGLDGDAAYFVADEICKLGIGDDPFLYDLKGDLANLERLARGLKDLVEARDVFSMTQAARDTLSLNILRGPHQKRVEQGLRHADEAMTAYMEEVGKPALDALHAVEEHAEAIYRGVCTVYEEIQISDRARKTLARVNLRGVQMVAVAHDVWERTIGRPAPKRALNPASPFGRFIADLFDALGIDGDPKAAFRAWRRELLKDK